MDIKNKIEEILLTDYQYIDRYTVDKLLDLFAVSGRIEQLCSCSSKILSNGNIQFSLCRKCQEEMNEHN